MCYSFEMEPSPAISKNFFVYVMVAAAIGAGVATALTTWGINEFALHKAAFANKSTGNMNSYDGAQATCNVIGIQIHGNIVASRADIPIADTQSVQQSDGTTRLVAPNYTVANEIEDMLRNAATDENIKAVLVDVNSGGGGVVAGDEIALAVRKTGKTSVAVIHEVGASSGYLAAAGAERIFASEDSTVGSIGETASYVSQVEKDKKEGLKYETLSSGPFKDMFSPDKSITDAERALIMRDVKIGHDNFVKLIADYRHQPVEAIQRLADGSTMLGKQALEAHLIDQFGGTWEALDYLEKKVGEPVSICWQ